MWPALSKRGSQCDGFPTGNHCPRSETIPPWAGAAGALLRELVNFADDLRRVWSMRDSGQPLRAVEARLLPGLPEHHEPPETGADPD